MKDFEILLNEGEAHLKASRPDLALPQLLSAMELAPPGVDRMRLGNTIAGIMNLMGSVGDARAQFRQTLEEPETGEQAVREQKAIAYNNLGRLSLSRDPEEAVAYFDRAVAIFADLAEGDVRYYPHLAHSHMARGEALVGLEKYWHAKKDFKKALELHKAIPDTLQTHMRALAYHQLGAIYSEEFNAYDAQTNYRRALDLYGEVVDADPDTYKPLLAATLNNLAVVQIQLEEYDKALANYEMTLEQYQWLAAKKPEVFEPYLAATYSNLGILLADHMDRPAEASLANEKAMQAYQRLAGRHPDRYSHYLATALHNAGIYRLDTEQWPGAAEFLKEALVIRRELASRQGEAFSADYCATALNLLELYQRMLEEYRELIWIGKGRDLLKETEAYLEMLPDLPSAENMKSDYNHLRKYFNEVDVEQIRTLEVLENLRLWEQETDSTLEISEKKEFQARCLQELRNFYVEYPGNTVLVKPLVLALNNMAWLHVCEGDVPQARELLSEGKNKGVPLSALDCNLAHCDLMEGGTEKALKAYRALFGRKNESNRDFREVIGTDLQKLQSYGVLPIPAAEVLHALEIPSAGAPPLM